MEMKQCPECKSDIPKMMLVCPNCAHLFVEQVSIYDVLNQEPKSLVESIMEFREAQNKKKQIFSEMPSNEQLAVINMKLDSIIRMLLKK